MRRVLIVLMFFLSIDMVSAQTGPVLDIRMDEGDGKTVFDASGNGNDGTHYGNTRLLMHFDGDANDSSSYGNDGTVNGATLTTGVWGNGLEFDGVDDYVEVGNDSTLNITDAITISVWIKHTGRTDSYPRIVVKQPTNAAYLMFFDNASNEIKFRIKAKTEGATKTVAASHTPDSIWHHFVGTFDGSTMKIFKDGIEINNLSISDTIYSTIGVLVIGGKQDGSQQFNGTIDEVAIYSKALSASEISDLYNAKKAKFVDWTDGKVGNALEFDGKDDYVKVLNTGDYLNGSAAFTILSWIKRSGSNAGPWYSTETIVSNYYHRLWLGKESDG